MILAMFLQSEDGFMYSGTLIDSSIPEFQTQTDNPEKFKLIAVNESIDYDLLEYEVFRDENDNITISRTKFLQQQKIYKNEAYIDADGNYIERTPAEYIQYLFDTAVAEKMKEIKDYSETEEFRKHNIVINDTDVFYVILNSTLSNWLTEMSNVYDIRILGSEEVEKRKFTEIWWMTMQSGEKVPVNLNKLNIEKMLCICRKNRNKIYDNLMYIETELRTFQTIEEIQNFNFVEMVNAGINRDISLTIPVVI